MLTIAESYLRSSSQTWFSYPRDGDCFQTQPTAFQHKATMCLLILGLLLSNALRTNNQASAKAGKAMFKKLPESFWSTIFIHQCITYMYHRITDPQELGGNNNQGALALLLQINVKGVYSFFQIFLEHLLCARHCVRF